MSEELKFIQVGELAKGITENILPESRDLTGRSLKLYFEDGSITQFHFKSFSLLCMQRGSDSGKEETWEESVYRATCPRKGIYLVDYLDPTFTATSVSLVIDLNTQSALSVTGTLPSEADTRIDAFSRVSQEFELTAVSAIFLRAGIDRAVDIKSHPHKVTHELVGKRVKYVYSKTEAYEHIYLNPNLYTWHCLEGIEKGLADTDRCHYYKIAEALYLFVWREKIVPTLGVVLIDLEQMKTTGKLFGYEGSAFEKLTNAPIGAHATLLNQTSYE